LSSPPAAAGGGDLWVVRHAQTEWSAALRHTGRTDVPLTDRGRQGARALRPALAAHRFALVLTSPLRRARETCELAGFGERAIVDEDLCEWDYGAYEGQTSAQIRARQPDWDLWRDGCPGGESLEQVAARAQRVIARARAVGGDAIAFAHGHILRVLAALWIEAPPAHGARLMLGAGRIGVLSREHAYWALGAWNLPAGGEVPHT
jgi:broad specificity phosphatase PhoE